MNAKELRIGNLVDCVIKRHHERFIEIESIDFERVNIHFREYNISDLKPISLTEEWLLKFGFENLEDERYDPTNKYARLFEYRLDIGIPYRVLVCHPFFGWFCEIEDSTNGLKFKYVHQLQNLYFALTGEELTLKD